MKNVIYYENVIGLGGTTTYEIELCKKYYKTKDITLYYKRGDKGRIKELEKYVRCVKWEGEIVECDNLFTNYDHSDLERIKANKYIQILHCQYKTNRVKPKIYVYGDRLFDLYICVSEVVKREYQELTGLPDDKFIVSSNPLTIDEKEKKPPLIIGSFTRLDWEKGKDRMETLIRELDRQQVNYLWFIFTNDINAIRSDNVIYQKLRSNVRNIMAMCDIVCQLSLCEGDCYAIKEAKAIMDKVLITPCESFFSMGCDRETDIVLEYDMSNLQEVVDKLKKMGTKKKKRQSNFVPKQDLYNEILIDGNNDYFEKKHTLYKVKALKLFETTIDIEIGRTRKENEEFIVNGLRINTLLERGLVEVMERIN